VTKKSLTRLPGLLALLFYAPFPASAQATTSPVRLYLIDTAVKDVKAWATWFNRNPQLTMLKNERVALGTAKAYSHGTKMLSIIAGPETGAALGVPIQLVSYDVYEGSTDATATTNSGNLTSALGKARIHHLTTTPSIPGVVCIASGTTSSGNAMLQQAVNAAVAAGLTVVVSAGNLNIDASGYIPAAYGTNESVICAGAKGINGARLPSSNFGTPVDVYAPGENVATINFDAPKTGVYDLMSGTSPAAALTTAKALKALSANPTLTPAQVEDLVVAAYTPMPAGLVVGPGPEVDTDADGSPDVIEAFFASDVTDPATLPLPLGIAKTGNQIAVSFQVSEDQFNPLDPYNLTTGGTWKVQISGDLGTWQDASGSLVAGTPVEGLVPLTFSTPITLPNAFLRVQVKAPVAAP